MNLQPITTLKEYIAAPHIDYSIRPHNIVEFISWVFLPMQSHARPAPSEQFLQALFAQGAC